MALDTTAPDLTAKTDFLQRISISLLILLTSRSFATAGDADHFWPGLPSRNVIRLTAFILSDTQDYHREPTRRVGKERTLNDA